MRNSASTPIVVRGYNGRSRYMAAESGPPTRRRRKTLAQRCHDPCDRLPIVTILIGYPRVSTVDQKPHLELNALHDADCEQIFTDKATGARNGAMRQQDLDGVAPGLQQCRLRFQPTLLMLQTHQLGCGVVFHFVSTKFFRLFRCKAEEFCGLIHYCRKELQWRA